MIEIGAAGLAIIAAFVAGFWLGGRFGTKDTERRWSEAVARAEDRRKYQT
jgi:hypothetical protein